MKDCHTSAWNAVTRYMEQNLQCFSGRVETADSTVMPSVASWVMECLNDIPQVRETDDHAILGWLPLPTAGVIGAQKWDFVVTFVCNLLAQFKKNGVVLIIHSNRAAQLMRSPGDRTAHKKHSVMMYFDCDLTQHYIALDIALDTMLCKMRLCESCVVQYQIRSELQCAHLKI